MDMLGVKPHCHTLGFPGSARCSLKPARVPGGRTAVPVTGAAAALKPGPCAPRPAPGDTQAGEGDQGAGPGELSCVSESGFSEPDPGLFLHRKPRQSPPLAVSGSP